MLLYSGSEWCSEYKPHPSSSPSDGWRRNAILGLYAVMAIAKSLGNRHLHQKMCRRVEMKRVATVAEEMTESATAKHRVIHDVAT